MINFSLIPKNSGCYIFKNKDNKIIYIGKAKNLNKRVKSYFQKSDLDSKTQSMLKNIHSFDFIVTDNEVEALILENNLIKKNHPKYNINLRDSKSYALIRITDEKFPRLVIARRKQENGKFFGPFVSAETRDYILHVLRRAFKLRTCKRFPKKPCLRYHIHLCCAPCIDKISENAYLSNIKEVEAILKGNIKTLLKNMAQKMESFSEDLDFEHAIELRNRIKAVRYLEERQNMERQKKFDEDIINYMINNNQVYLMLFSVNKGVLENKQEFIFENQNNFFEEFILSYYSENKIPSELIIPKKISATLIEFLNIKRKKKINVVLPKKGERKQLLKLVLKNIEIQFFGSNKKLEDLKNRINLHETPKIIECFDISHISGSSTVGAMVQFINGNPDKSQYRKFKIRTVEGIDDVRALAEVVRRRYTRLVLEKKEFPNLIIIDGGKAQLNFTLKELKKLNLNIPIISIAKRLEEIYVPGKKEPILLNKKTEALRLIQSIRDEAHRFAITYNRLLRKKEIIK